MDVHTYIVYTKGSENREKEWEIASFCVGFGMNLCLMLPSPVCLHARASDLKGGGWVDIEGVGF